MRGSMAAKVKEKAEKEEKKTVWLPDYGNAKFITITP